MPSPPPPSRSELEKSVSARRSRESSSRARKQDDSIDPSVTGRRQTKVLGGDPNGVKSKSLKHFLWAKVNAFGIANSIASAIVLLILAAFFWPQKQQSVQEVILEDQAIEAQSFYTESRVDDIPDLNEGVSAGFTRETDIPRAEDYREQDYIETRSNELLEIAENQLTEGSYTLPRGANAAETYREILALNPNNVDAKRGLEYISGRFVSTGTAAVEQGNFAAARTSLERLGELDPDADAYTQLAELIEAEEKALKIKGLLAKAEEAFEAQNYILPAQNNAWSLFKQVLEIEPDNELASAGVARIADVYIALANSAAIAGEYQAAAGYLATVGVVDPENPTIEVVEKIISTAKPLADRARDAQTQNASNTAANSDQEPIPSNEQLTSSDTATDSPSAESEATQTDGTSSIPTSLDRAVVSQSRTPEQEAAEQAAFDRQYLDRGLAAYYKGDYEAAAALLKPLADKGISRAQFRIAYMHYLGRGFPQNRSEADRIIRAALPAIQAFASEGRAWAQSDLGSLYEDGLVLPRDYKEAFFWYRAAAEQGYAGAQTNLGVLYAEGLGVAASRSTAIDWFEKAAAQGDAAAARNLAALGQN